jgi:hypothetical protein
VLNGDCSKSARAMSALVPTGRTSDADRSGAGGVAVGGESAS